MKKYEINERCNRVGGEAVIEGVMMKAGDRSCTAIRMPDKTVHVVERTFVSARKKHKFLGWPIIRGVVSFVESLILSFRTLTLSAEAMGEDEELEQTKFEVWLEKTFGKSIYDFIMVIGTVLGFALAFGLFFYLPMLLTKWFDSLAGGNLGWFKNLIEGVIRIGIFVAYIALVSLMPDIRRTFQYHGAEHKSIFCYEAGLPLTVENVRAQRRFHPRCGTSFIFVIMILSIIVFSFVTWDKLWMRLLLKLPLLPVITGVGFEFLMYSGKHDNVITRIATAPGLWMQRLTTREPDDDQIEIGITALKSALNTEFPDLPLEPVEGKEKEFLLLTDEVLEARKKQEEEPMYFSPVGAADDVPAEQDTPADASTADGSAPDGENA